MNSSKGKDAGHSAGCKPVRGRFDSFSCHKACGHTLNQDMGSIPGCALVDVLVL